jgi:hypothetical protein
MESLRVGHRPNLTKHVAGNQVEEFIGIQTQPEPEATQPTYDPTVFGLPPQPAVKPGVAPQILTQDLEMLDIYQDPNVQKAFQTDTGLPADFVNALAHVVQTDVYNNEKITKNKLQLINAAQTRYQQQETQGIVKPQKQRDKKATRELVRKLTRDPRLKLTKLELPSS